VAAKDVQADGKLIGSLNGWFAHESKLVSAVVDESDTQARCSASDPASPSDDGCSDHW
jgi:hypothetical protein